MQPRAVLVLYQPGTKLKNSKYLLSLGANIVGSNPRCSIYLSSAGKYFPQEYVANFYLTEDFMYIQALCDNMVQMKSNMQVESSGRKKDVYKSIEKSCRYVLQTEQIFYIGPYRAITQVQSVEELRNINNVLNIQNFETPKGDKIQEDFYDNPFASSKKQNLKIQQPSIRIQSIFHSNEKMQIQQQKQKQQKWQQKSDRTQKIQSEIQAQFQPTMVLDDNQPYLYQPTLALDDNMYDRNNFNVDYSQKKSNNNTKTVSNTVSNNLGDNLADNLSNNIGNNVSNQLSHPSPQRNGYRRSPLNSPMHSPKSHPFRQQSHTKSVIKIGYSQKVQPNINSYQIPNNISQFSQISMFTKQKQRQKRSQPFSQQQLYQDIKKQQTQLKKQLQKQQNHQNNEQQDSMPQTIQDNPQQEFKAKTQQLPQQGDQMPATIRDDDEMPATIRDQDQMQGNIHMAKTTKSLITGNQSSMYNLNNLNKNDKAMYKSEKYAIDKSYDDVQDVDTLLGWFDINEVKKVQSNQIEIGDQKHQNNQQKKQTAVVRKKTLFSAQVLRPMGICLPHVDTTEFLINNPNSMNNMILSNMNTKLLTQPKLENSFNMENSTQKKSNTMNNPEENSSLLLNNVAPVRKKLFKESQKSKLLNFSGYKPSSQDRVKLRTRGYQPVPIGNTQKYDVLIIGKNAQGNYDSSSKLTIAVMLDKMIVTEEWVKQNVQPSTKYLQGIVISGISWSLIQTQMGKQGLFQNTGSYYMTKSVDESYNRVLELCGCTITQELNKRKKVNMIIDCEVQEDRQFWQKQKTCKNWKFYGKKLFDQSVLVGQILFKKYAVDGTSF